MKFPTPVFILVWKSTPTVSVLLGGLKFWTPFLLNEFVLVWGPGILMTPSVLPLYQEGLKFPNPSLMNTPDLN
jgi:hypothetical protein